MKDGKLFLFEKILKNIPGKSLPEPREFLTEEPKMVTKNPSFSSVVELGILRRGATSPLMKYFPNVHIEMIILRADLYHKMGIKKPVKEIILSQNDHNDEIWRVIMVTPQEAFVENFKLTIDHWYDQLTSNISLDVAEFEEYEKQNHKLSYAIALAELYAAYYDRPILDIMAESPICNELFESSYLMWKQDPSDWIMPCKNWLKGQCSFGEKCRFAKSHFVCTCRRGEKCRYKH